MPRISTEIHTYKRIFAANSTASSFAARSPTATAPSANLGFFSTTEGTVWESNSNFRLFFFGAGSAGNTFSARAFTWDKTGNASPLWVPRHIVTVDCTLDSVTGSGSLDLASTDLLVKTIALNSIHGGTLPPGVDINSVATSGLTAELAIDVRGGYGLEMVTTTGGSATNANGCWKDF